MVCGTMMSKIMLMSAMIMSSTLLFLMSMNMLIHNTFIIMKIPMINIMSTNISVDMLLDWTSLTFMSTVLFISSMIIMFSMYYMPKKELKQFMLIMFMFIMSMNILIISNNMILMLLGWDGLGLSSYMLVVYYQNNKSAASGSITMLTNRMGDILILLSISLMTTHMNWNLNMNNEFTLLSLILLTMAACSKSAQFPFSAWLPMAMAAPTPISALVHSSTLVTAGVFLMLRLMNYNHPMTIMILMTTSTLTALFSSMSANWEQDMKKIIALSTLSQIAMMMFAISLQSLTLAYSHLIIHAFFKSTMFICAGIMIHESSYQDMRMLSMNFKSMPLISSILGMTSMALMGIPFTSGFFSKDAIIEKMISSKSECILSMIMIMSIMMTAMYSMRMIMSSNTQLMKTNPNMTNHSNMYCYIPILMLSPMAITLGSLMLWMTNVEQIFIMNMKFKMMIIMSMSLGLLTSMMLQFKSKTYLNIGMPSISMWFIHLMSSIPMKFFSPLMNIYKNNDHSWQENYGPLKLYLSMKMILSIQEKTKILMLLLLMTLISPIMMY